jgi:hypothetical protein
MSQLGYPTGGVLSIFHQDFAEGRLSRVPFDVNGFLSVVGSEYGDRLNQVDFRISKLLRFAKTRTMINLDVFNVFNGSTVTTENVRIGAFRQPTNIMLARFVKIGAQFDF